MTILTGIAAQLVERRDHSPDPRNERKHTMQHRIPMALATALLVGATAAQARVADSWTDLDPKVRAAEEAARKAAPATQPGPTATAPASAFNVLDRTSPL